MQDDTSDKAQDKERSAPAAEADLLGEAARNTGTIDALQPARQRPGEAPRSDDGGEAQPGKDENQAGFVKDADKKFSP